ncbi:hypothetical protein [Pseudofrankia sp. BMG5.36]|uniref:hypothetical protein n=1 Tax=Pseudofrankia sp. BMG5.36 TaxID=1834512 RepID=UPI0009198D07|nr:hypothetical protein [Pseudofrankia sp. BMG5.36]OHV69591.1 hypothetical protein BCD48_34900 [Pseudofrankia sp. BMG5.36]
MAEAVDRVERAIDQLVDDFAAHPFRHRVEHSLHLQLYRALADHDQLDKLVAIGGSDRHAGLIHKEWPMSAADHGRRGLFDLVVLAPSQLAIAGIDQYLQGRIEPPVAIEPGLGYGLAHLTDDITGLVDSHVPYGYIVHFSRLTAAKDTATIERTLTTTPPNVRTAYARILPDGKIALKHLADDHVATSVPGNQPTAAST